MSKKDIKDSDLKDGEIKDPRFSRAKFDPKFLPIDGRTTATDPRLLMKTLSEKDSEFRNQTDSIVKKKPPVTIPFGEIYKLEDEEDKNDNKKKKKDLSISKPPEIPTMPEPIRQKEILEDEEEIEGEGEDDSEDEENFPPPPELNDQKWLEKYLSPKEFAFVKEKQKKEDEESFPAYKELTSKHPSYQGVTPWDIVEATTATQEVNNIQKVRRFAVTNHDFGIVNLLDLFAIFANFCPKGGNLVKGVKYFTRFGEEAIKKDLESAPKKLEINEEEIIQMMNDEENEENNEDEEEESTSNNNNNNKNKDEKDLLSILEEKRTVLYEMQKLRYYFAVFEFDSPETCLQVYDLCNGYDVEDTQQYLDLSLVPREKSFENYIIVEGPVTKEDLESGESDEDLGKGRKRVYNFTLKGKNKIFNTPKSLERVWDAEDLERKRILDPRNFENVSDKEIMKYLNCDDEEDSDEEEDLDEIRKLLLGDRVGQLDDEKEEEEEEEKDEERILPPPKIPDFDDDEESEEISNEDEILRKLVHKAKGISNEDEILRKLVHKAKGNEKEKEFNLKVDRQRNDQLKASNKEGEKKDSENVDLNRFSELLNNPEFQIDPSHHKFTRAKNYSGAVSKKKRTRRLMEEEGILVDETGEIKEIEPAKKKRKVE